ncbi:hypothetical protein DP939_25130 [Spongiactinospora rosea]|uniref:Uncharacterized protein n=1 Tax=Spongiactinospora rosea TaxID=2248750 RepID=A0A366LUL0_9ACTN|nr:hypothetical protein [Spongiactinospora rosea]RBQ17233.1 hypothetical protein DP939_25130 [Spongiactinospora rosea]
MNGSSWRYALARAVRDRVRRARAEAERGSASLEKIVWAALLFTTAVGVVAGVVAVINHYAGMIR